MSTKANIFITALFTILATQATLAQSPSTNLGTPPPPSINEPPLPPVRDMHGRGARHLRPERPAPPHGPLGRANGLISLTTVSGTVGQLTGNDDAIFDGFTLNSGSGTTTVKFPPHLGQEIQKAVKPGTTVSVTGYSDAAPGGETPFRMNSLTVGKTTIQNAPPAIQTTRPAETLTTVNGKITDYRFDRSGRVNGLVLDDKTIIRIPGHAAYQLTNLATKGTAITVQGYPRTLREGQVQLEKLNIIRASVLTINGQQYLVR